MDLKKVLTVSGYPDLFKVVKEARKGVIVESLLTGKRMQVFLNYKVSTLDDIAVFTSSGDVPLKDVFMKMYKKLRSKKAPQPKDMTQDEIRQLIVDVLPNYDSKRVYLSDMRKIIRWYNLLLEKGYIKPEIEESKEEKKEDNENREEPKNS